MTLKAAAAGLDQGGGKVVVMLDPARPRDEATLRALGARSTSSAAATSPPRTSARRAGHELDRARDAVGDRRERADGGSGDPSPTTAVGVVAGIRAVLRR